MGSKTAGRSDRNSNLELLRIFCIIAIIADHFTNQSGVLSFASLQESFFYSVLFSLGRVSCSVFVIISAWFLADRPFKARRIFHTWITVVMYAVPVTLAAKYVFHTGVNKENLYGTLFPVEESPLWFAGYYIVLLAMSPFLNMLLKKLKKTSMETALFFPFVFIVLYSTITRRRGEMFKSDMWVFLFLYLLTGYFKKNAVSFGRKKSLAVFLIVEGLLCSVRALTSHYGYLNLTLFSELGQYTEFYRGNIQTLPNLLLAYSLFFLFKDLKIRRSRLINTLAGASLGVYCIHQVPCFYSYMWENIFLSKKYAGQGIRTEAYTILVILIVWLGGTVIELTRMKLTDRLIESGKWYENLCLAVDQAVNSMEENQKTAPENCLRKLKRAGILLSVLYFLSGRLLLAPRSWYLPLSADSPLVTQMELALEADVHYNDGSVQGTVTVRNKKAKIEKASKGKYPVRVGVSLVDADGEMVNQNYLRLDIKNVIGEQEEIEIPVQLDGLEEHLKSGGGIRFAVLQEAVGWREDTSVFYWFED